MKAIKIQKTYIQTIEVYQTGYKIELEDWINPKSFLNGLKEDNPDFDIDNYIQFRVDKDDKIRLTLYALDVDRIDF